MQTEKIFTRGLHVMNVSLCYPAYHITPVSGIRASEEQPQDLMEGRTEKPMAWQKKWTWSLLVPRFSSNSQGCQWKIRETMKPKALLVIIFAVHTILKMQFL